MKGKMPENYYADAEAPAPQAASTPAEPAEGKEESGDSETAVLPKTVLGGKEFKPGEEVMLEVVQVNEDSVVVKYASEKPKEEEPAAEPKGGEMTSLMDDSGGGGNPGNPGAEGGY
jgi:antitoxin component of MazEF toxin-antitoxin module